MVYRDKTQHTPTTYFVRKTKRNIDNSRKLLMKYIVKLETRERENKYHLIPQICSISNLSLLCDIKT